LCDATSTTYYATTTAISVPASNYSIAQSGGTGNPYTAGGTTSGCTQYGCCGGANRTCNGSGSFGACSIVADSQWISVAQNGSYDHNCDNSITYAGTWEPDGCSNGEEACTYGSKAWSCACGASCAYNTCTGWPSCQPGSGSVLQWCM
jgi:hypothetical protein